MALPPWHMTCQFYVNLPPHFRSSSFPVWCPTLGWTKPGVEYPSRINIASDTLITHWMASGTNPRTNHPTLRCPCLSRPLSNRNDFRNWDGRGPLDDIDDFLYSDFMFVVEGCKLRTPALWVESFPDRQNVDCILLELYGTIKKVFERLIIKK